MKNTLVVKHNSLVEARYNLTLNEQKVIIYAVTQLDRERENFDFIELDINEFAELLDKKGKRYEEIRDIARGLRKKEIIINTAETEYISGWFSSVTFFKNTSKIRIRFDNDLIPYLLLLKRQFTRYQLQNILYLKNKYSIRLYELMKQYQTIGKRTFDLEELKKILMIEGKYERIYDLEERILRPVEKEINIRTDINISYEKIRKGRKVMGFIFKIEEKDKGKTVYNEYLKQYYNIPDMKSKMGIASEKLDNRQVMEIYELAIKKTQDKVDVFEYVRLNYIYVKNKGSARNIFSYLLSALEEDYALAAGQLNMLNMISN